jgi:metal-responsive CopG/Arc/MetJ family transcriptional regulator
MTILTLKVPRELAQKLEAVSVRKRVSKSKIIRDALDKALQREKNSPNLYDLMKDGLGCINSGKRDLATNPKHLKGLGQWQK